jgi:hypothetical protein
MEVTFQTEASGRVVTSNVVDIRADGEQYHVQTESSAETISGNILGAVPTEEETQVEHASGTWSSMGAWGDSSVLAIQIENEEPYQVPEAPLASEAKLANGPPWKYDPHYSINRSCPECETAGGICILRNVVAVHRKGVEPSTDIVHTLRENDGFSIENELGEYYFADFGSAWRSAPLPGTITRITQYNEQSTSDETLEPTEQTADRVKWAFE